MRRFALVSLVVMVIVATSPAQGEGDVRERNRAWVLAQLGGGPLSGTAMLYAGGEGREVPIEEAVQATVDRFGDVDSAGLASAASNGEFPAAGDVWLYEVGYGDCPRPTVLTRVVGPQFLIQPFEQFNIYGGPDVVQGYATSSLSVEGFGEAVEWATKTAWAYSDEIVYGGHSDFFCFEWAGLTINFPFINGVAHPTLEV